MSRVPYFPFYPLDFIVGVRGLNASEVGIYIMLLCRMYEVGGPIESDTAVLAAYCGCRPSSLSKAVEKLLALGKLKAADGQMWNERAIAEIDRRAKKLENAERAGKKSAEKRVEYQQQATASVERSFNHTDTDIDTLDANASKAPPEGIAEVLWTRGVAYLVRNGVKERQARSIMGRWRKESGDAAVFEALKRAAGEGAAEPVAFITAVLKPKPSSDAQKLEAWGIKEHDPDAERIGERPQHRDTPRGAGAADMPRVQPYAEGFASEDTLPFGDDDGGWTASALPSLRLVGGCAV